MIDYSDKQQVFDAIKAAKGDELWAMASTIALKVKAGEDGDLIDESEAALLFDDPVRARAWWLKHLRKMVEGGGNGAQQAAGLLQKELSLVSGTDDLDIHTIEYTNALIDCPHCGANVHEASISSNDAG